VDTSRTSLGSAVRTDDLARVIERAFQRGEDLASVASRSTISERALHRILRREYGTTSEKTADKIIVALGEATAIMSGEVQRVLDGRCRQARRTRPSRITAAAGAISHADLETAFAAPAREPSRRPIQEAAKRCPRIKGTLGDLLQEGLLEADEVLVLFYKGERLTATLTEAARIRVEDGREFDAPSQASEAVKGVRSDAGWNSWLVEREGTLIRLTELRAQLPPAVA
jgi:AraC-like DNA-binding protein